jgi:Na+/H+-translocating membrane pyrophosphatase
MSDKSEKPESRKAKGGDKSSWTGKAALAGAAIGSAALAAALLYASRRKEEAERKRPRRRLDDALDTD